jgi:hypothetical protein
VTAGNSKRAAIAFCFAATIAVAAEPPVREQFAYSMPLAVPDLSPVVTLEVPAAVYRECVDPGLRDLRVLNGAGEVVPYALRRQPVALPGAAAAVRVPLFPLRGDATAAAAALKLSIDAGRTQLEVQGAGATPGVAPISAWLMNTAALDVPIDSFTWEWPPDAADFSVNVLLEASDDLEHWRAVAPGAPLARLRHGGEVFEQRGVSFAPRRAKFWRVSVAGDGALPALTAVSATPRVGEVPAERLRAEVGGAPQAGQPGDYLFDLGAQLPVDRVELVLPDINTVAEVEFFARRAPRDAWQSVARGAVYRLRSAHGELTSPAMSVEAGTRRLWRVRVNPRGGGIGQGAPRLRAGWLADQLVFVTRGAGPFELVYGSFAAPAADVALASLLPAGNASSFDAAALPMAQALEPQEAGGRELLDAPPPERPWRAWVLWAALLAGVATLGALAWSLSRQMRDGS